MANVTERGFHPRFGVIDARGRGATRHGGSGATSAPIHEGGDLAALLFDLQIRQAELESQNEELRRTQAKLVAARDRYADLYDSAPAGYLTLNRRGAIIEANLRAAAILSAQRAELLQRSLADYVCADDQDVFCLHLRRLFGAQEGQQTCELRLAGADPAPKWAGVRSTVVCDEAGGGDVARVVMIDISERKQVELKLAAYRAGLRDLSRRLAAGAEQERVRLAREVHDGIGQDLIALKLGLSWLDNKLRPDQQQLRERVAALDKILQGLLGTVRRIATELRPAVLDDLGLDAALTSHFDEFCLRTSLDGELLIEPALPKIRPQEATALYRAFQEALTNVARHADASRVRVTLRRSDGRLALVVADNGRGIIERPAAATGGLGIIGMRERIEEVGGQIEVVSEAEQGTTVSLFVPLAQAHAAGSATGSRG